MFKLFSAAEALGRDQMVNGYEYHAIEKFWVKKKKKIMIKFTWVVSGMAQASNVEHSDREKGG